MDMTKEKLIRIIDGLHLQTTWINLCIDSVEALTSIDVQKRKKAPNFVYIAHSSLIYRYTMELTKLLGNGNGLTIYRIMNYCCQNSAMFKPDCDIVAETAKIRNLLKEHDSTIKNLIKRRNKTYAHNDEAYFLFSKKTIEEFPLSMNDIKSISYALYSFSKEAQRGLNSARKDVEYPAMYDDVKHLFGEKTDADKWLEETEQTGK